MKNKQVKIGAILSYCLIIINSLYGLIITPYILGVVGDSQYGVYKTITSLSSSLLILDLGLGGTLMRYIAKFRSDNEEAKIKSFISMSFGEGFIINCVLFLVCFIMYFLIPIMYDKTFTPDELELSKIIFIFLSLGLFTHIIENLFNGIITGYNKFIFANGSKLIRILIRIISIYVFIYIFKNVLVLVIIDLILTTVLIIIEYLYCKLKLKLKIKISFKNYDKTIFSESFKYTILLFLTSIVVQVNSNLDNVIIGAIKGPTAVTVYSMALLIFGMFQNLSVAISEVMLPTVTNVLKEDPTGKEIQKTIIQVGRIQFILLGAAFVGFSLIGKLFIELWLGDGFLDVYYLTLILMLPSLFELCVNVCLTVLRAQNRLTFRTIVLFCGTILNAIITIVGVTLFNYYAAAIGTALSFIIVSLIIMNIYYYKVLGFNMFKIYFGIFKKIWICLLISGCCMFLVMQFLNNSWKDLVLNIVVFCIVYVVTLLLFGLNKDEKGSIPIINKMKWR